VFLHVILHVPLHFIWIVRKVLVANSKKFHETAWLIIWSGRLSKTTSVLLHLICCQFGKFHWTQNHANE